MSQPITVFQLSTYHDMYSSDDVTVYSTAEKAVEALNLFLASVDDGQLHAFGTVHKVMLDTNEKVLVHEGPDAAYMAERELWVERAEAAWWAKRNAEAMASVKSQKVDMPTLSAIWPQVA